MSLNVTEETDSQYHPVFLKIMEDIPGGITLMTERIPTASTEIKAGALIHSIITTLGSTLASSGLYRLCKTAKLAVATTKVTQVTIAVYTNHEFKVGEFLGIESITGATIAAITKGAVTDQVVFTANGGYGLSMVSDSGAVLEEKSAITTTTPKFAASAILRQTVQVRESDLTTLRNVAAGAVVRGTLNEGLAPYFVTTDDKVALTAIVRWV